MTLLDNTAPLPVGNTPSDNPASSPWAIQLANGSRCVGSAGANSSVGGVGMLYYCLPSTALTSTVDETNEPWSVQFDPSSTASVLTSMAVTIAWD